MKLLSFLFAVLVLIAPAHAYQGRIRPPGEPARPNSRAVSNEAEAQRVMNAYARCLVRRERRGVERFLETLPGSPDWIRSASRIATPDCLYEGELKFKLSLFRGALYEALYRLDFASENPVFPADELPIVYTTADPASLSDTQRAWLALHYFGNCVVRASPAAARAVVLSEIPDQEGAFQALYPALAPCLTDGMELTFSQPILRGLIAESLYRLTAAAVSAPAAGAER